MKRPHLTDVLEKTSKSVFMSTVVVSSDSLSPTASTSSATKTLENVEEDRDHPEPAD